MRLARSAIIAVLDRTGDIAASELLRAAVNDSGLSRGEIRSALRDLVEQGSVGFVSRHGQTMASRFAGCCAIVANGIALVPEGGDVPGFSGLVIRLSDGPAFGSGEHATTRLCLSALKRLLGAEAGLPPGLRGKALDAGCGTGVLSVAAVLLGVGQVLAADLDPWAVFVTRKNAEQNNVGAEITAIAKDAAQAARESGPFGLVLANLRLPTLLRVLAAFYENLEPGGCLVCSGITREETGPLRDGAKYLGLSPLFNGNEGRWAMEAFRRPTA